METGSEELELMQPWKIEPDVFLAWQLLWGELEIVQPFDQFAVTEYEPRG